MNPHSTSGDAGLAEARLAATAAAVAGDAATLYRLVSGLMSEGISFEAVLFDVLAPTEQDVGTRWQRGDYLVAEEHAATATVETVVSLLAGSFHRPSEGIEVVVATAEGDHHSLPARLVSAHLLSLEYRTTFLGANVLAHDLQEYLEVEPPGALIVSCAMTNHLVGARATVRAGHAVGSPVIVGGRGLGESGEWAGPIGADAWAPDPREVPPILESWSPHPAEAESRAVEPSQQLSELIEGRASVIASAQRWLAERGVESDARVRDELSILLGAVEASLLVGDDQPIADMLAWQRTTLAAHQMPSAEPIADSLRVALSEASPEAEQVMASALHRS